MACVISLKYGQILQIGAVLIRCSRKSGGAKVEIEAPATMRIVRRGESPGTPLGRVPVEDLGPRMPAVDGAEDER